MGGGVGFVPGVGAVLLLAALAVPIHAITAFVVWAAVVEGRAGSARGVAPALGVVTLLFGALTIAAGCVALRVSVLFLAAGVASPSLALGAFALQVDALLAPRASNRAELGRVARLGPCALIVAGAYGLLATRIAPALTEDLGGAGRVVTTLAVAAVLAVVVHRMRGEPSIG